MTHQTATEPTSGRTESC